MNDLYDPTCKVCGGLHLQDLIDDTFGPIYDDIARQLLNDPNAEFSPELYNETARKLINAINQGMGGTSFDYDDDRNLLATYLSHNIYKFSAAKSLVEMEHFRNLMTDEKGNILGYDSFKAKVANEGKVFNNRYLKSEYNVAKMSAINGNKFNSIQSDYLQFSTVGDNRVRLSHKLFDKKTLPKDSPVWHKMMPPLDFGCRCTIIPGKKELVTMTEAELGRLAKEVVTDPLFFNNPGESKVVYKDGHPYFQASKGKESQLSFEQYGLEGLGKILTRTDLPAYTEKTMSEYLSFWKDNANHDGNIIVKDHSGKSVLFTDKFKEHINDGEPRYKYGTELKNIIKNADEVWGYKDPKNQKLNQLYIRYYEPKDLERSTGAIVIVTRDNVGLSLYEINEEKRLSELRRGILEHQKK